MQRIQVHTVETVEACLHEVMLNSLENLVYFVYHCTAQ